MIGRFALAAAAVILIPAMVVAQPQQPRKSNPERKTCEIDTTIGTRLGNTRRCRTKAERDAHKAEARNTVDRMQAFKPVVCGPDTRIPSC